MRQTFGVRLLAALGCCLALAARAEVALDGSLGPAGALPGPDYAISTELGQREGANLFHSFSRFGLQPGESASFSGPAEVLHVIGRVTGGEASFIDGLIRSTLPAADLYLFNPAGLLFGPHAQLDLPGAFYASSADYLTLQDNGGFSASLGADSLLSSAPPQVFGFLGSPAPLAVSGAALNTAPGQSLSLIGGDVILNKTSLVAEGGRLALVSLAGPGEAAVGSLEATGQGGTLLLQDSRLETSGPGGGAVYLRAGQIELRHSSALANSLGDLDAQGIFVQAGSLKASEGASLLSGSNGGGQGGQVSLGVGGTVEFSGATTLDDGSEWQSGIYVSSVGEQPGAGGSGGIDVQAGELALSGGASLRADTQGTGHGGEISVSAGRLRISGESTGGNVSSLSTTSLSGLSGAGNGGAVRIEAGEMVLEDGGQITVGTLGTGDGGAVEIQAGSVVLRGASRQGRLSGIHTQSFGQQAGAGDAGGLNLRAGILRLEDGAAISANTHGPGSGGDVRIEVSGPVNLNGNGPGRMGSTISANTYNQTDTPGRGGSLELRAQRLELADGAWISSLTTGTGEGGRIYLEMQDTVRLSGESGTGFPSSVTTDARGQTAQAGGAGELRVAAGELEVRGGGMLSAGTAGPGRGGNLVLQVRGPVIVEGGSESGLHSRLRVDTLGEMPGAGQGGKLSIQGESLILAGGGEISADSGGPGQGGDIDIQLSGPLSVSGESAQGAASSIGANSFSEAPDAGAGGNVTISAEQIVIVDGGSVTTFTSGEGRGGNIQLEAREDITVAGEGSWFRSGVYSTSLGEDAQAGRAGDVALRAATVFLQDGAMLSVDSFGGGDGGDVRIAADRILLAGTSAEGHGSAIFANAGGHIPEAGAGGTVYLQARELELSDGAIISVSTRGPGRGGGIEIDVAERALVHGDSGILSASGSASAPAGDAGGILLKAGEVEMDHATLSGDTFGPGRGGHLVLQIAGTARLAHTFIASNTHSAEADAGAGGLIEIEADKLVLSDGTVISNSTYGSGQGGKTRISVAGEADFGESAVISAAWEEATGQAGILEMNAGSLRVHGRGGRLGADTFGPGQGGDVRIAAGRISLEDRGTLSASSRGRGNAGEVHIYAEHSVTMHEGFIETRTQGAQGGNLTLASPGYLYMVDSEISTSVHDDTGQRKGSGGDIRLEPQFIVLDNSKIIARAVAGDGGQIDIKTSGIYRFSESPIDAISVYGESGVVTIDAPDVNVAESLNVLPTGFLEKAALRGDLCSDRAGQASQLLLLPFAGSPPAPEDWLPSR